MNEAQMELVACAARLVVEEGLDYGPAKARALKQLGWSARTPLPSNEALDEAVREYLALFCGETQALELAALRRLALQWMERLAAFRPHLSGPVWMGTATRLSDIKIELYCDDPKSAELALIDMQLPFEVRTAGGANGQLTDVLSLHVHCRELQEKVGVHLLVLDRDDIRGARRTDSKERALRADLHAVRRLVHDAQP